MRTILPCLNSPDEIHVHPDCLTPQTAELLLREADRIQQRIDCLARNRDAIRAYLAAIQLGTAASPDTHDTPKPVRSAAASPRRAGSPAISAG